MIGFLIIFTLCCLDYVSLSTDDLGQESAMVLTSSSSSLSALVAGIMTSTLSAESSSTATTISTTTLQTTWQYQSEDFVHQSKEEEHNMAGEIEDSVNTNSSTKSRTNTSSFPPALSTIRSNKTDSGNPSQNNGASKTTRLFEVNITSTPSGFTQSETDTESTGETSSSAYISTLSTFVPSTIPQGSSTVVDNVHNMTFTSSNASGKHGTAKPEQTNPTNNKAHFLPGLVQGQKVVNETHTRYSSVHAASDKDHPHIPHYHPTTTIASKRYRGHVADMNRHEPKCWPHCPTQTASVQNKRHKKHSNSHKKKFYNYKLLYDTIKKEEDLRRQETDFYVWIFGATMLSLGAITTFSSCVAFCLCSEEQKRKRRKSKAVDKSGIYERVDSVSSMVSSHVDPFDLSENCDCDSVTVI